MVKRHEDYLFMYKFCTSSMADATWKMFISKGYAVAMPTDNVIQSRSITEPMRGIIDSTEGGHVESTD